MPIAGKIFFTFIFLAAVFPLNAQIALGIETGMSRNYLHTSIAGLSYTDNKAANGLMLGASLQYQISGPFSIKILPSWMQKNYTLARTGPYTGIYETFLNSYIQFPVLTCFEFGNSKIKEFVDAGVYGAYWTGGRLKGRIPDIYDVTTTYNNNGQQTETFGLKDFRQKYIFDPRKDKKFESGVMIGAGTEYFLNKNNCLSLAINYSQSLTDQQKKYMIGQSTRLNQTFTFAIGYIRHFKSSRSKSKLQ